MGRKSGRPICPWPARLPPDPCGELRNGPSVRCDQFRASQARTREACGVLPVEAGRNSHRARPAPADGSGQFSFRAMRAGASFSRNSDAKVLSGHIQQIRIGHYAVFDMRLLAGRDEVISDADLARLECPDLRSNANPERWGIRIEKIDSRVAKRGSYLTCVKLKIAEGLVSVLVAIQIRARHGWEKRQNGWPVDDEGLWLLANRLGFARRCASGCQHQDPDEPFHGSKSIPEPELDASERSLALRADEITGCGRVSPQLPQPQPQTAPFLRLVPGPGGG